MLKEIVFSIFILKIIISSSDVSLDEPILDTEMNFSSIAITAPVQLESFKFLQRLDHFSDFDNRKFLQNYWVISTYYKKGGPAFLFINGESPVAENYDYGFPYTSLAYAQNLSAICFSLEHRFYSKTWTVNASLTDHLNRAQALADIENFIKGVTKDFHLPEDIKWISFGCSYAGNLAALSRLKYKDLIFGSVASSAPLLSKLDYFEHGQIVEESLRSYDSNCVESITLAFEEINNLVNNTHDIKNIAQLFNLGENIPNNVTTIDTIKMCILLEMMSIINSAVQHNDVRAISIPVVCRIMVGCNSTKLEALAEVKKLHSECKECHRNVLSGKSQENEHENPAQDEHILLYTAEDSTKAWTFQRCSEFGYFSSFTNVTFLAPVKHLLPSIKTSLEIVCKPFFGTQFSVEYLTEKINHMNILYGGLDYNVSRTIFIHSSLDPWYKTGIYRKSNNSLYESIFIQGTSHCGDIYPPSDRDGPELKKARRKVLEILRKWLDN